MIPDLMLAISLHAGERPATTTESDVIAAAARVPGRWSEFARCVSHRESHGNYRARNPHSSAMGRWQFLDRQWRTPLAYMVAERLKAHGIAPARAKAIRLQLQRAEIARWPGRLQDVGFVAVITHGGAHHWRLAGSPCEAWR